MRTRFVGWTLTAVLGVLFSLGASACNFYFNYDSISAPIGTVGEIGIQVQKTHNNCTLPSMEEYAIEGTGIQILGETAWEDKGGGVYEKWVQISLSSVGSGSLKISKTCTKEGYEEKVLPIATQPTDGADTAWVQAWSGTYPFDVTGDISSVTGSASLRDGILTVDTISVPVGSSVSLPEILPNTVRLFTLRSDNAVSALLIVGDGVFIRFDHLSS
ncbi:hypothetical protein IH601_12770 [Candidatus Bipolaricaulota bacterium]|nr:hypothetical protein [Candidatus Bipolaricaulota bacterium]TFH10242.1 MAG: hypothetical protein E4H08_04050 [Candidatus Atribacteria bacterium]